jgi:L-alanine-DL-glutamate epimerase-like enolase superfamily enzyme
MKLSLKLEQWPLQAPFRIAGHTWFHLDVLLATLESGGHLGTGEAAGVYYKADTPASMIAQIEPLRARIEAGITRAELQTLLPAGGARNALDCALWDLEARVSGRPVWQLAELSAPQPLLTTFTCSANEPAEMAATARAYQGARAIKMKLTGEPIDAERVRAVRSAMPEAWLGVDANQAFTRATFRALLPVLLEARIALIEQPFPVGQESLLDDLACPIPIAADESVQTLADLPRIENRVRVVNIKLDKCGGLTEGLALARAIRDRGLDPMVGNMIGTTLAMAPAYLVGQLCKVVDLDGPVFLTADRHPTVRYQDGFIECSQAAWGGR